MSNIHDRKQRARELFGGSDAEPLLAWLNRVSMRENETAQMALARVLAILEEIVSIQRKASELKPVGDWKIKPKIIRDNEAALNVKLSNYEFVYGLDYSKSSPMVWSLRSIEDPAASGYVAGEALAVHHIVELAKLELVDRVRKCGCGSYFFARLPSQRFHAAVCRVQFWESSPERKERRREKARQYYNLHKSGKVR